MDKYEVIPVTLSQGRGEEMVLAFSLSKGLAFQGRRGENNGEGYNLKSTSQSLKSYMNLVSQISLVD